MDLRTSPGIASANAATEQPPLGRDRLLTIVLLVVTALGVVGCVILASPFVPALAWALALAVVTHPVHDWIARRVQRPGLAAGIAVTVITIGLLAPAIFVAQQIGREATDSFDRLQKAINSGELESKLEQNSRTAAIAGWVQNHVNVEREMNDLGESLQRRVGSWVRGTVWTITQVLITIFVLFYLFRDRGPAMRAVCAFLPLSGREAGEVVERVRAMIHATIYGTVVVAAVQGALGGLMFGILKIPGALLWGVAMGVLAIIPVLGAFVIWIPAAIALALEGSWGKAAILTVWGTVAVGLIDNLLYPVLVGKEMRLHTVPVFFAIVGGLLIFGASGLVLGPVILTLTLACIDVLHRRTAGNRSAEEPT
jgi:predicted PurR-regulated permease PerM